MDTGSSAFILICSAMVCFDDTGLGLLLCGPDVVKECYQYHDDVCSTLSHNFSLVDCCWLLAFICGHGISR